MIRVEGLAKRYGETTAVQQLSFEARAGEVFGLLGPNGAGKSTTIGCVAGLVRPSQGRVLVDGHDVAREGRAAKRDLGVVPQDIALYPELSAAKNLAFFGGLYGHGGAELTRRVTEVLEHIGLADRAHEAIERFSGGMKRRLNFGCGIVHSPRVVLLDEPTVGVDPQSRAKLLEMTRSLADSGACVLYTTHYMEEAEALCDRLAIVDHGRLLGMGTLEELRTRADQRDGIRLAGSFPDGALAALQSEHPAVEVLQKDEERLVLSCREAPSHLAGILATLEREGAHLRETTLTRASLETLFLQWTGRELRE